MNKKISYLVLLFLLVVIFGGVVATRTQAEYLSAGLFQNFLDLFERETKVQEVLPGQGASQRVEKNNEEQQDLYKPAMDYENAVIDAVDRAAPAVVSIAITKELPIIEQCPYNPFDDRFFQDPFGDFFGESPFGFYRQCETGETEEREVGGGTGFIVSSDGMVVTNKHVVADTEAEYTVLTNDGEKHKASVLARDPAQDIAILDIEGENHPKVSLGNSDTVQLGQTAIAIGNALGEFRNTVSVGVVSGLARDIVARSGVGQAERLEGLIQTDAAINRGNSGGPLLNLRGEVIGVNTAMAAGAQNIGFAIPVDLIRRDIDSVERTGKITAPFLGVRYILINEDVQEKEDLEVDNGALLRGSEAGPAIVPDSPAADANLMAEDIILEVNGEEVTQEQSLASLIRKYQVGERVELTVLRKGAEITVTVVLGSRNE